MGLQRLKLKVQWWKFRMIKFFIVYADNKVGAVSSGKCPTVTYAARNKFVDFIKGLREDYPGCELHCVRDEALENKVRDRVKMDKIIALEALKARMR